ncbi:hypothetical protein [Actinomadura rubrisoli]|uniref:Uncharacterized protein n=1 Tax=Actinomadura rubrisoli TaxID=2530368 RepID=A0A4R5A6U0_9ACTN|nr:hypothetical protein [Actinomadura rubrisoli]TDD66786.1 hypothetical protein E1298_39990 [Actinomadura rubrisoli]
MSKKSEMPERGAVSFMPVTMEPTTIAVISWTDRTGVYFAREIQAAKRKHLAQAHAHIARDIATLLESGDYTSLHVFKNPAPLLSLSGE